jgi:imidazoleglycerol-phosphate dehydratase/histidinol-phosphatase
LEVETWLVWDTEFKREMWSENASRDVLHFFKSFSDGAKANINIKAEDKTNITRLKRFFKAFGDQVAVSAIQKNDFT